MTRKTADFMSLPYNPALKERARELRRAGNLSEVLLWQQIKNGQFSGLDFDRQKIIGNYIVDFYCAEKAVVIEVDGSSHDSKAEYDAARDAYLTGLNLTVIHVLDSDVKSNLAGVMQFLQEHPALITTPIRDKGTTPPLRGTPPEEGNGTKNSPPVEGWQAQPDGVVASERNDA
jgi:very-short-patch-repair endonuclease